MLLGELMNSLKLFPFMNKGRLTGTDDLNNVLTSGIYEISAPTTGVLNGKDIQYGILIVFSAGQRIQLLGNGLYGNAYFRTGRDNGRWYDWVSIYWHKIYSKRELGELIGINDTWIRRRFAIKDCNTAIAGAYNVDDSTTNNFPTGAYKFGTLLVANSGFFGSQYFVPDNFNVDPYIYIRSIGNNGNTFNQWAKIKVTIIT